MLGGLLALLSAATFGLNNASVRRGMLTGTVLQGIAISVPLGVPIFFVVALASGSLGKLAGFSTATVGLLALAGIVHFIAGRYSNYRALKAMGTNLVGPVQTLGLVLTLGLAVWLLDEKLTPLRVLGIALVFLGPIVMLRSRKKRRNNPPPKNASDFQPKYLEGFFFAFTSAVFFSSSPIIIRAALQGTSPGAGLAGGVISYATAAVLVIAVILPPKRLRHALDMDRTAAKWFTIGGVFVCVSQIFRFMALSVAPVTVVTPIQQTSAIFRTLFSWLFNRESEDFSFWVLTGIAVSLIGALALTVSVELVISLVPLPEWIVEFARWQWP